MSTQRFMPRIGRGSGRCAFAVLLGALLALEFLLPSAAFARSNGRSAAFSPNNPSDYIRDAAGVSVVRLVATYAEGTANKTVTCTSLGILVGSGSASNASNTSQNWVLADATLVNTTMSACGSPGGTPTLATIQIWASNEYTATPPHPAQQLGALQACQIQGVAALCEDGPTRTVPEMVSLFQASPADYALFSFQTTSSQPYLTPNFGTPAQPALAVGLTDGSGNPLQNPVITSISSIQGYLQPNILSLKASQDGPSQLTPAATRTAASPVPTSGTRGNIGGGTPVVDATGELVGMYVNGGAELDIAAIKPGLEKPGPSAKSLLVTNPSDPVKSAWDTGIKDYYQSQYQKADQAFQPILNTTPDFKAPETFDALAVAKLHPATPTPGSNSKSGASGTGTSAQNSSLLLIVLAAGVIVLVLLLILVTVLVGRAYKRRRELDRFAVEQLEAQRQAEADIQHQRQAAEEIQRRRSYRSPEAKVPCPNCRQPVRLSDTACPNCRYPLSPSASGLGVRLAGSAPLPPVETGIPAAPEPLSIAEQPTLLFQPNVSASSEASSAEKTTVRRKKPVKAEQPVQNLLQGHARNLDLKVGTVSDPGLKRKYKPNEDSLFAMQGARTHNSQPQEFGLFVVADGMGGHANGQDASRQAIQTMIDFMLPRISSSEPMDDETFTRLLGEGVQHANQAVHQRNIEVRADMGTTMTTSLVVGSTAYVANVGDSRTYLYREGQGLSKVTNDHSVVASLVEAGIIQPDDIYTHPKRNQIYRSLGEKPLVEVDTFKVELQPGDKLLLCSDGLWDMVRDPKIQQILSKPTSDPNKLGQELIKAALEGGGEDNVSVIVVQVVEVNQSTGTTGVQILARPDTVTLPNLPPV
jgi:serine/threonine protein phosphatase PrpC